MTTTWNGAAVEADEVEYEPVREPWGEVRLEDGTRLRTKLTVTRVRRIVGQVAPDGAPLYAIESATVFVADVPPHLAAQAPLSSGQNP